MYMGVHSFPSASDSNMAPHGSDGRSIMLDGLQLETGCVGVKHGTGSCWLLLSPVSKWPSFSPGSPFRIEDAGNHLLPFHTILRGHEMTMNWGRHYPTLIDWHAEVPGLWERVTLSQRPKVHCTPLILTYGWEFCAPGDLKKHWKLLTWRGWDNEVLS